MAHCVQLLVQALAAYLLSLHDDDVDVVDDDVDDVDDVVEDPPTNDSQKWTHHYLKAAVSPTLTVEGLHLSEKEPRSLSMCSGDSLRYCLQYTPP